MGFYTTLNSGLQQGLLLTIHDYTNQDELFIWASEVFNEKRIMIVVANNYDIFDEMAYKSAKYFDESNYNKAVNYAYNIIKKKFPKNFKEEYNTKFKMHKSLVDLQKIVSNSKNLEYEDYYELATFEDIEQSYFCDLVIIDGILGLEYSKYSDSYSDEFENLYFEKWEPNLSNEVTLMLGMQDKLKQYIEKRIDYDTRNGIGI